MAGMKAVIGMKDGRSVQKEIAEADAKTLLGKKIGDTIKGEIMGLTGYEFKIAGGSDYCGFPMRSDVPGFARRRILTVNSAGVHGLAAGIRVRKTVCGSVIHPKIVQVNLKVVKEGAEPLAPPKEAKPAEGTADAAKAAAPKPAA